MKSFLVFIALILLMFASPAFSSSKVATVGEKAPDFESYDVLTGKRVWLSGYLGRPVVLEWTNHECPYVRKHYESGNMQKLQQESREDGAVWISIVSSAPGKQGHTTPEEARKVYGDVGSKASVKILDESGEIGLLYGAKTTPHMFVIDKDGILVYAGAIDSVPGTAQSDIERADNYVTDALADIAAGVPVKKTLTRSYGCSVKY